VFELSPGQRETVFGGDLTGITYDERWGGKQEAHKAETTEYDLPAQGATSTAALRINGWPIPSLARSARMAM
jgi:hypothetical protein